MWRPPSRQGLDAVDRASTFLMPAPALLPFQVLLAAQDLLIVASQANYRTKIANRLGTLDQFIVMLTPDLAGSPILHACSIAAGGSGGWGYASTAGGACR